MGARQLRRLSAVVIDAIAHFDASLVWAAGLHFGVASRDIERGDRPVAAFRSAPLR